MLKRFGQSGIVAFAAAENGESTSKMQYIYFTGEKDFWKKVINHCF